MNTIRIEGVDWVQFTPWRTPRDKGRGAELLKADEFEYGVDIRFHTFGWAPQGYDEDERGTTTVLRLKFECSDTGREDINAFMRSVDAWRGGIETRRHENG